MSPILGILVKFVELKVSSTVKNSSASGTEIVDITGMTEGFTALVASVPAAFVISEIFIVFSTVEALERAPGRFQLCSVPIVAGEDVVNEVIGGDVVIGCDVFVVDDVLVVDDVFDTGAEVIVVGDDAIDMGDGAIAVVDVVADRTCR